MAEEALRKLEEQLNCPICLDTYTDPKLLQCNHVYCRQCLVPLVDRDQGGITCPACRRVTPIPERGVAGLPPAFHINHLLDICKPSQKHEDRTALGECEDPVGVGFCFDHPGEVTELYCMTCGKEVCYKCAVKGGRHYDHEYKELDQTAVQVEPLLKLPQLKEANLDESVNDIDLRFCLAHHGKECELFCETCEELMCLRCALKGGEHHDHWYDLISSAFERYKVEIISSIGPMEEQVVTVREALALSDKRFGKISDQQITIAGSIRHTFRQLQEILKVRETELINELDQITQVKLKSLARQKDLLETTLVQLNNTLHSVRRSLLAGNEGYALKMKSTTVNQVSEMTTPFQPDLLVPNTEAGTSFSISTDLKGACENYGQITTRKTVKPAEASQICHQGEEKLSEKITDLSCVAGEDLEFSFMIDSHKVDQVYSWSVAGVQLYLPPGPLPQEIHGKPIHLKTGIKGSYQFPPNSKLVSAIYNIVTDLRVETAIQLEHCYKGDLDDLAFVYCDCHQPPFEFRIARRSDFKYSFTLTHGTVSTNHFSYWAIVWLSEGFKGAINRLVGYQLLKTYSECIRINAFYCINQSHIRVDLVFLKGLSAHSEVVRRHYCDWRSSAEIKNARFDEASTAICVRLGSEWSDIGNGWKLRPECNPEIEKKVIEDNREYFDAIKLVYKWTTDHQDTRTLDHKVVIEGVRVGDSSRPVYLNLLIDRTVDQAAGNSRPDMVNLRQFRGRDRVLNIIEEIGSRYWDFGIQLLNDTDGNYMSGIVDQMRGDFKAVNSKIATEWVNGRPNAKLCTWRSLIETLQDIGMTRTAREIEDTLRPK